MKTLGILRWHLFLLTPILTLLIVAFQAQDFTVKGLVTDKSTQKPILEVNVSIEGTKTVIQVDNLGNYSIDAENNGSVLVFSCFGYKTKKVIVGDKKIIDIELEGYGYTIDFSKGNQLEGAEKEIINEKPDKPNVKKDTLVVVDYPSYPGGTDALLKFIISKLKYPEEAKKSMIEGTVMVRFMINIHGMVEDCKVYGGVDSSLSKEAFRIVNLIPAWNPGHQDGKPVPIMINMPIVFKL